MEEQVCDAFTKEYRVNNRVLIIENVFSGSRSKPEVVGELIESGTCSPGEWLAQIAVIDDCGSSEKEKKA